MKLNRMRKQCNEFFFLMSSLTARSLANMYVKRSYFKMQFVSQVYVKRSSFKTSHCFQTLTVGTIDSGEDRL